MLDFSRDPAQFRKEIRAWLAKACPAEMKGRESHDGFAESDICWGGKRFEFSSPAQKEWMQNAASQGMTVPAWPVEYGGAGLTRELQKIWQEELSAIGAKLPLQSFGIWMLGPALLAFGTEEQKKRFLPEIARGEIRWCQGYSEPGAGSDLANVQTRAEDMGDHWLINGQKIWTSYADQADWIFALVRTDRDAPKHKGISFMLIDMTTPGVTTKPIRLISGKSPFCETFFDNVKVPKEHGPGVNAIVGEQNRGWDVAKHLLTHEREMIGSGSRGPLGGRSVGQIISNDADLNANPVLRSEAMKYEIDSMAVGLTLERYKDMAGAGVPIGNASSMLKYQGTELNKRGYELLMSLTGSDAAEWDSPHGELASEWLRTKANSIEGGTSEVMLDIIAKRVLELPYK